MGKLKFRRYLCADEVLFFLHSKLTFCILDTTKEEDFMEYKKHFTTVEELLQSEEFKKKDLSYCDLYGLDLKDLPWSTWKGFKFFHTNFKNTNIIFEPVSLRENEFGKYCLEYCDFTGCDLSYIRVLMNTTATGSIFKDTHLSARMFIEDDDEFRNVVFSEEMANEVRQYVNHLDISALILNPHIPFSSLEILTIIRKYLPSLNSFLPVNKLEGYLSLIAESLKEDHKREGALCRLYTLLDGPSFSPSVKIRLFQGLVKDQNYARLDLSSIPAKLLEQFEFRNCHIDELILPSDKLFDFAIHDESTKSKSYTSIPHIVIEGMTPSSWQTKSSSRVGRTCFTRQTNLYLELGRKCNAKCSFCRNHLLPESHFDYDAVMTSFRTIEPYLNNVVIGGGEPTLPPTRQYLSEIRKNRQNYRVNYFISTNGSAGIDYISELINDGYKINLSRHALEDADNDIFFSVNTPSAEEIKEFVGSSYYSNYLTLVATCFEEGLGSVEALERYIELADYLRLNSVLFQSLHEDLDDFADKKSRIHQIDDMVFDEVIAHLREQGYFVSELPIYSTGDYKLIIVKSSNNLKTISFKKYITKEELEREWPRASKRTFDLSIAPNGDIFQNWHQSSDKVLCNRPEKRFH